MTEQSEDDIVLADLPDDELVEQMWDDLYDGLADEIVHIQNRGVSSFGICRTSEAEVHYADTAVAAHHHVVGLKITMDQALAVRRLEATARRDEHLENVVDRQVGPHRALPAPDEVALVRLVAVQVDAIFVAVDRDGPEV